jgi:hypothetical protein
VHLNTFQINRFLTVIWPSYSFFLIVHRYYVSSYSLSNSTRILTKESACNFYYQWCKSVICVMGCTKRNTHLIYGSRFPMLSPELKLSAPSDFKPETFCARELKLMNEKYCWWRYTKLFLPTATNCGSSADHWRSMLFTRWLILSFFVELTTVIPFSLNE